MAISATGPSAQQAIAQLASMVVNRLVDGLQQSEQSASGDLEESISFIASAYPTHLTANVMMAKYGPMLDKGRKPGTYTPISALLKWLSYPNVRDRLNLKDQAFTDKEARSLAYLISRKHYNDGTKGNHFIDNLIKDDGLWNEAAEMMGQGVVEDMGEAIVGQFTVRGHL